MWRLGAVLGTKMVEFSTLGEVRSWVSKTAALYFWRVDFELFRALVGRVPWESVLKDKEIHEGWMLLKKEVLKVQAVPLCCMMSQTGRKPVWLNRELLMKFWSGRKSLPPVEERTNNSGRVQGNC